MYLKDKNAIRTYITIRQAGSKKKSKHVTMYDSTPDQVVDILAGAQARPSAIANQPVGQNDARNAQHVA